MDVKCDKCGAKLTEPGALVFGPPDDLGRAVKRHLCGDCWAVVRRWFRFPAEPL